MRGQCWLWNEFLVLTWAFLVNATLFHVMVLREAMLKPIHLATCIFHKLESNLKWHKDSNCNVFLISDNDYDEQTGEQIYHHHSLDVPCLCYKSDFFYSINYTNKIIIFILFTKILSY